MQHSPRASRGGRGRRGRGRGRGRGKRGSYRGRPYRGRPSHHQPYGAQDDEGDMTMEEQPQEFTVVVKGYPPHTQKDELIQFLQQNAQCNISRSTLKPNICFVNVNSYDEFTNLLNLNGISFKDTKLNITEKKQRISLNRQFIFQYIIKNKKYNKDKNLLSLSNLPQDENFIREITDVDFNNPDFVEEFFKSFYYKFKQLKSLDLSRCQIRLLSGFKDLQKWFPKLQNLSFDYNIIDSFNEVDHLRGLKLREISFKGNPIQQNTDRTLYTKEMLHRFPHIKFLDHLDTTESLIKFPVAKKELVLPPARGMFMGGDANFIKQFVLKYCHAFDNDRNSLLDAYDETDSFFSLTVSMDQVPQTRSIDARNAKDQLFKLREHSRNLIKVEDIQARSKLLINGKINIVSALSKLPKSIHSQEDFFVDSHVLQLEGANIIVISMHGRFKLDEHIQSFDRIFILAPPRDGSKGWPCTIINDQLHIRPNLPMHDFTPKKTEAPLSENALKIQQLSNETNLRPEVAEKCLSDNNWDYGRALEAFRMMKSTIPPHCFKS